MKLSELVGIHVMTGVEIGTVQREGWWDEFKDCNYVKFRLDGVTYMAVEDPDDGYRSCCRELEIVNERYRTSLPDILVECKMRDNSHDGIWGDEVNDILEFYDAGNNQMFMAVGTGNTNDYYPYFVFEYVPEVLHCNGGDKQVIDHLESMS